ncbi:ATP:cob(I)alamin adenosyltransferase [Vibrio sp.]|nr:ATP:cob(I)alamin adenosyltransferase [Vibrio sp.]
MAITFSGDFDELSYPYIHDKSSLCDFEVFTDELCTMVGMALSQIDDPEIKASLLDLQPKIFHLNGSIRGKQAIFEEDITKLKEEYWYFRNKVDDNAKRFVLPRGGFSVYQLHYCRSLSKKVIRILVRVDEEGIEFPDVIPRFSNVLVNYFFALTRYLNQLDGVEEPEFISKSYRKSSKKGTNHV